MTTANDHISRGGQHHGWSMTDEGKNLLRDLYCLLADVESEKMTEEAAGGLACDMAQDAGYVATMEVAQHVSDYGTVRLWGVGPMDEKDWNGCYRGPGPGSEYWDRQELAEWRPVTQLQPWGGTRKYWEDYNDTAASRALRAQEGFCGYYVDWPVPVLAVNHLCADGLGRGLLRGLRGVLAKRAVNGLLGGSRRRGKPNPRRAVVRALAAAVDYTLGKGDLEAKTGIKKGWSRLLGAATKATQADDTLIGCGLVAVAPTPRGAKGLHYRLTPLGQAAARYFS